VTHEMCAAKLDTYLDGELESTEARELDQHLRECSTCAVEGLRRVQWKRAIQSAGQRYTPDPGWRDRVQKSVAPRTMAPPSRRWWPAFTVVAATLIVFVSLMVVGVNSHRVRNNQILSELADLHVSTLASSSPVDVVSSDRHTVKPWFAGKIPFTFDLPDLQGTPFELVGGRVSYLEQSPGAELVVRVRKHQVSVFIFQEKSVSLGFPHTALLDARSFHLETFERSGLRYFIIGDVAEEDIQALATRLQ
jgi:anti-sigma factor RsiW